MKVTTEQKESCITDLHIELPPERFHEEWKSVGEEYRGLVTLPGFRKGKAPLSIVEKRYGREIEQEVTRKLIDTAVREAFTEQKLFPIQSPSVRDVTLEGDRSLRFSATIVTRPEVNLPEYGGLEVTVEKKEVSGADVEQFLDGLRGDLADFQTVEGRTLAMGDFAVLDYEGSIEGKGLAETYPDLQPTYAGRKNFWIKLEEDRPIPGLAAGIAGMSPGETRDVSVAYPAEFGEEKLRGYKVSYKVTLHEVKERVLPPLDDAFAAKLSPGSTLDQIRTQVKERLESSSVENFARAVRAEVVRQLLEKASFELPSTMVQNETTGILRDIIRENQQRGVSEEEIRSHQEELLGAAKQSAGEKVKLSFLLGEIAAKEGLRVSREELAMRVVSMSEHYRMTPQKLLKELQKHGAVPGIEEEILLGKALDTVVSRARVNGAEPTPLPASHSHDEEPHVHGPGCGHEH